MGVRALKFFREVVQDKFTAEAPWTGVAAEVVGIMGLAEAEAEGGGEQEATALTTIGETFDEIPISLARENFRQKMLSCGCGPSSYPFYHRQTQHSYRGERKISRATFLSTAPTICSSFKLDYAFFCPDR